jgi:acyl-CoA thioesterase I
MLRIVAALIVVIAAQAVALARPIHIVAFGDSMTAGWLVKRQEAYPAQLQAALRKRGYDVNVTNAGINGGTSADALLSFDQAIGPDTDIAIVEFGTNDRRRGVPMQKVRTRLTEIIRALHARKIGVLVIGFRSLKLGDVAHAEGISYAEWDLPPGKYRAPDHAHYNAQGYAIVVARMLPQVEALIASSAGHR